MFSVQHRSEKKCTTHWNYRDRNAILARIRTSRVCTTLWLFRGWNCQPVSARPWRKTDERGTGKIKARWAKQKEVKCDWNMNHKTWQIIVIVNMYIYFFWAWRDEQFKAIKNRKHSIFFCLVDRYTVCSFTN